MIAGMAGAIAASPLRAGLHPRMPMVHSGHERAAIRVGLVGCGGRGVGAAMQAAAAAGRSGDASLEIAAIGDLFSDAVDVADTMLTATVGEGVFARRRFVGVDACERVCAEPIDLVILATPPFFRPSQVRAAVERGLHVYAERPLAVDASGMSDVRTAGRVASERGLSFMTSLSLRHDPAIAAAIAAVGDAADRPMDVVAREPIPCGWRRAERPLWTAEERRMRNWLAEPSLSGGLFLDRCFDAVDLGAVLLGGLSGRVRATARPAAVECRDAVGRGIRVEFAGGDSGGAEHGAIVVKRAGGDRVVVTAGMRRRAAARGFAAAWDRMIGSVLERRPLNDCDSACHGNEVALAMARAAEALITAETLAKPAGPAPAARS